jgi:asparagine synthase (glutamine-hydrolysing)
MIDSMRHEDWYESELFESGSGGIGILHHGSVDPDGHAYWRENDRAGVIYGAITNPNDPDLDAVFERMSNEPAEQLRELDGCFAIAYTDSDADRFVLATDKLASRPIYYRTADGFLFGSEVKSILTRVEDPEVNVQAISDLILMGHMWGEKTLVEGIRALPPATVIEYDGGAVSCQRYWQPAYGEDSASEKYLEELVARYRDAVDRMAATLSDEVGLWLSGGLDSRSLATLLRRNVETGSIGDVQTYTYDANPGGGTNLPLAGRTADTLGFDNQQIGLSPERLADCMEKAVSTTDGMVRWNSLLNLSTVFYLPDDHPGVVLEACGQGELLGEHLKRYHLEGVNSAAESMYRSESTVDEETVRAVMDDDVDPKETFRRSANQADGETRVERILDAHFSNHYSRFVFASNQMARSQVGTRLPYPDGAFLGHVARLPRRYRMGTVPFTGGAVPYGASRPKLHLVRALNPRLAQITYERTSLSPRWPYYAHVGGFVLGTGLSRLLSKRTHGGTTMADRWYRNNETLREYVDDLLDSACDRPFFDADRIRQLQREHREGIDDHTFVLAPISTAELWIQKYVDVAASDRAETSESPLKNP